MIDFNDYIIRNNFPSYIQMRSNTGAADNMPMFMNTSLNSSFQPNFFSGMNFQISAPPPYINLLDSNFLSNMQSCNIPKFGSTPIFGTAQIPLASETFNISPTLNPMPMFDSSNLTFNGGFSPFDCSGGTSTSSDTPKSELEVSTSGNSSSQTATSSASVADNTYVAHAAEQQIAMEGKSSSKASIKSDKEIEEETKEKALQNMEGPLAATAMYGAFEFGGSILHPGRSIGTTKSVTTFIGKNCPNTFYKKNIDVISKYSSAAQKAERLYYKKAKFKNQSAITDAIKKYEDLQRQAKAAMQAGNADELAKISQEMERLKPDGKLVKFLKKIPGVKKLFPDNAATGAATATAASVAAESSLKTALKTGVKEFKGFAIFSGLAEIPKLCKAVKLQKEVNKYYKENNIKDENGKIKKEKGAFWKQLGESATRVVGSSAAFTIVKNAGKWLVKKGIQKIAIKLATKGITKAGGAAIGSAIGSVFPGIGNAVGAVVGLALGCLAEWGVNKLINSTFKGGETEKLQTAKDDIEVTKCANDINIEKNEIAQTAGEAGMSEIDLVNTVKALAKQNSISELEALRKLQEQIVQSKQPLAIA